ncbi:NAD(P)/FAD-dependent oxidoreductase [Rhizobiaceae bacterium BDR2-2]|uniref:Pyridine nucleotide-disulfide oxidoreductase domain-containing protein 2 n=1 Tax=Ectorhizobium quercum TaxID=2965071 RepID=A0AAE3MYN6_9HYPH|nr:NAD(P)/FAD-dependent oxidoreductase [Ectorhizobium quercum]MCX8997384.1 NAD(P)/FAD-dependent oxidoreductase [Ectorhizobium quercum]
MKNPDAIVIGGGHNGLICAGYLARAGLDVMVLERSASLGGPAATQEFFPGFRSAIANSPGSLEPKVLADFQLEKHGLRFVRPDPTLVHPLTGGRLFVGWREKERVDAQLDSFAPGESGRYHAVFDYLNRFAERLGISVYREPPTLQELTRNLKTIEDEEAFSRIFFGSVRGLFDHFGLAPETQAIMGPLSVVSGLVGPSTPGTPFNLMMRPLSLASLKSDSSDDPRRMPLRGSTGLAIGGMGAIVEALVRSVEAAGVELHREAAVSSIAEEKEGLAVSLEDGRTFRAPIVVSAAHPHLTVKIVESDRPEWAGIGAMMARTPPAGSAFKIVLALGDIPRFAAAKSEEEARLLATAQLRIAPTLDYLDDCHADLVRGRMPERPLIWSLCHSMTSPELTPEGKHILSINLGGAPHRGGQAPIAVDREAVVRKVVSIMSEWIPNLPDIVEQHTCIDAETFENELGLFGANIAHIDMMPINQFWMRPYPGLHRYRTPTPGLYLSGVGTWPGAYFSGIPGHNTAQAVLADLAARQINKIA